MVAGIGAVVFTTSAGCLGDDSDDTESDGPVPEPIDLSGNKQDDYGGMIIGDHFGPNGQIFYIDESPEGRENPAWFHTLTASLFPYHFERERQGWEAEVIYVTDYSRVDYEIEHHGEQSFISSHTGADSFERADDLQYVAGSDVLGGMGPDFMPFSDASDLDAFRDDHGGDVIEFSEIDEDRIAEYT